MQVKEGYRRLLAEVGSAQRLRDRAEESLAVTEPRQGARAGPHQRSAGAPPMRARCTGV